MSVVKRVESCPNVELSGIQMESEYLTLLSIIQGVAKHSIDTSYIETIGICGNNPFCLDFKWFNHAQSVLQNVRFSKVSGN